MGHTLMTSGQQDVHPLRDQRETLKAFYSKNLNPKNLNPKNLKG
jgi:hypothetical protein